MVESEDWTRIREYLLDLANSRTIEAGRYDTERNGMAGFHRLQGAAKVLEQLAGDKFADNLREYLEKNDRRDEPDRIVRV